MPVVLQGEDGTERTRRVDFINQSIRDASGEVEGIFVRGSDVTDLEAALAQLRESEVRFRTMADLVPQRVWSAQPDAHVDYYNRRSYEVTGVPTGASDGLEPRAACRRLGIDGVELAAQRRDGAPYEAEYRLRHHDGQYRWWLGRALPVRDESGAIVRWMGTCTDIHEIKHVHQMLEASQAALRAADRLKDHFLATLAHRSHSGNPSIPGFRACAISCRCFSSSISARALTCRAWARRSRPRSRCRCSCSWAIR